MAFAPEGRKANVNASSPTSLLEAMILAHDLIVLVSENTKNKSKSRDLEGARWTRVGRKKRLGRGRGPFRAKIFFQYIPCPFRKINRVLKNVRFNLYNFLHAALNWRDKDNLLVPLFHGFVFKTIFPTFSTFSR